MPAPTQAAATKSRKPRFTKPAGAETETPESEETPEAGEGAPAKAADGDELEDWLERDEW